MKRKIIANVLDCYPPPHFSKINGLSKTRPEVYQMPMMPMLPMMPPPDFKQLKTDKNLFYQNTSCEKEEKWKREENT